MGVIGDLVDAYKGESSGTTLKDFLDKFGSTKGRYVDTLDPLTTFDVKFKFFPSIEAEKPKNSDVLSRIGQSALNSLKSAGTNLLDSVTGGLFSALTEGGEGSVEKAKKDFKYKRDHTFMEYLAKANLLQGGEQWQTAEQAEAPLELQMGFYVQSITVPNLKMVMGDKAKSYFGETQLPGATIDTEGTVNMDIINTKAALHERIFYPWMREVTLPYWSYKSQPFTTATITVDFSKHNDAKYVFVGCYPTTITMMTANQGADGGNVVRQVQFKYDFMFVTSKLDVNDSVGSKLMGLAGNLAGNASKMMNL